MSFPRPLLKDWTKPIECDSCGYSEVAVNFSSGMSNVGVFYCPNNKCTLIIDAYDETQRRILEDAGTSNSPEQATEILLRNLAPCACGMNYISDRDPRCPKCPGHLKMITPPQVGDIRWATGGEMGMAVIFENCTYAHLGLELFMMDKEVVQELQRASIGPLTRALFSENSHGLGQSPVVEPLSVGPVIRWRITDQGIRYLVKDPGPLHPELCVYLEIRVWAEPIC